MLLIARWSRGQESLPTARFDGELHEILLLLFCTDEQHEIKSAGDERMCQLELLDKHESFDERQEYFELERSIITGSSQADGSAVFPDEVADVMGALVVMAFQAEGQNLGTQPIAVTELAVVANRYQCNRSIDVYGVWLVPCDRRDADAMYERSRGGDASGPWHHVPPTAPSQKLQWPIRTPSTG